MANPIEVYLSQLRRKLEARFEPECADQLLAEIRGHLLESAVELEAEGVPKREAERRSVSRFGAPERAAFLLPLGAQFGTGDRYWGRAAFGIGIFGALALAWLALSQNGPDLIPKEALRACISILVLFYAYACWRARSFSMVRQSSAAIALLIFAVGLYRPADSVQHPAERSSLRAELPLAPSSDWIRTGLRGFGDLGLSVPEPLPEADTEAASNDPGPAPSVSGMVPIGPDPWALAQEGLLPEASQVLLTWLFMLLVANAAVSWVGCLEHEQKGGLRLVQ